MSWHGYVPLRLGIPLPHCDPRVALFLCHDPGHCWREFPTEGALQHLSRSPFPHTVFVTFSQTCGGGNEFYRPDVFCLGAGWRKGVRADRVSSLPMPGRTIVLLLGLPTSRVLLCLPLLSLPSASRTERENEAQLRGLAQLSLLALKSKQTP